MALYDNLVKTLTYQSQASPTTSGRLTAEKKLAGVTLAQSQANSALAAKQWYDPTQQEPQAQRLGIVRSALKAVSAPLYGVAGAAETALGKGDVPGLLPNIVNNIEQQQGFSSLLKKFGAPGYVSVPLGFALDVGLDPVSWATLGSSTVVGRTAEGFAKAGLEGAGLAVKSRALELAASAAKPLSWIGRSEGVAASLADKAAAARDVYSLAAHGKTFDQAMLDVIERRANEGTFAGRLAKAANAKIDEVGGPLSKVRDFVRFDRGQFQRNTAEEIARRSSPGFIGTVSDSPESLFKVGTKVRLGDMLEEHLHKFNQYGFNDATGEMLRNEQTLKRDIGDALNLATDGKEFMNQMGTKIDYSQVSQDAMSKAGEAAVKMGQDQYGAGWYNKFIGNVKAGKYQQFKAKEILKTLETMTGLFKVAKVPTPTGFLTSGVGNAIMGHAEGLAISRPEYFQSIGRAAQFVLGKIKPTYLTDVEKNLGEMMKQTPSLFRSVFAVDPEMVFGLGKMQDTLKEYSSVVVKEAERKAALEVAANRMRPEDLQVFKDELEKMYQNVQASSLRAGVDHQDVIKSFANAPYLAGKVKEGDPVLTAISGEIRTRAMNDFIAGVDNIAKNSPNAVSRKAAEAFHWYLTKPMEYYEKIDQSYKLGTTMHLINNGLTEKELLRVSKMVPINKADVVWDAGKRVFKVQPQKAAEIALDTYMNYSALPPAVKILRHLPFVGAPFASFTFSMADKLSRTMIHNPDTYNKITFLLNSLQSQASETEKQAMQQNYPWMVGGDYARIPFFQKNPVYLNIASMIPQYSMTLLDPTQRKYEKTWGGEVASVIDRMPIFKSPEGQVVLDNVILPLLYKDDVQGPFGNRLYPAGAGPVTRALYAGRNYLESYAPGIAGVAGLAVPEQYAEAVPLYRARAISYAKAGKTPVGVLAKEPAFQRTVRGIMAAATGLNFQAPNINFTNK